VRRVAAAARRAIAPDAVDNHRAHDARRPAQEVHAVLDADLTGLGEGQVRVVEVRPGVKRGVAGAAAQAGARQMPRFSIGRVEEGLGDRLSPASARWISSMSVARGMAPECVPRVPSPLSRCHRRRALRHAATPLVSTSTPAIAPAPSICGA
jgi:hypothetical protein